MTLSFISLYTFKTFWRDVVVFSTVERLLLAKFTTDIQANVASGKKRFIQSLLFTLVQGLQPFLLTIIVASITVPAEFSIYRYVLISLSVLVMFANPGFQITATRMFASYDVNASDQVAPLAFTWLLSLTFSAVTAVVILVLPQTIFAVEGHVPVGTLALLLSTVAAQAVPRGALIGKRRLDLVLIADVIGLITVILGTWFAARTYSYHGALLALASSNIVVLIFLSTALLRLETLKRMHINLKLANGKSHLKKIVVQTLPLGVSSLAYAIMLWMISGLLLEQYKDPLVFAVYSIGVQWFMLANILSKVLCPVLLPDASREMSGGKLGAQDKNHKRLLFACVAVGLFVICLALITSFAGPLLIGLYGDKYAGYENILTVFVLAALPMALLSVVGIQAVAVNAQRIWMMAALVQLVVAVIVTWARIDLGAIAGALVLAIGACAAMAIIVFHLKRKRLL